MNYAALIQNRKSVREFRDEVVPFRLLERVKEHYHNYLRRLVPQIGTELYFFGTDAREALEGAAGYHKFLVGAPQYLVLLSEDHPQAGLNAGFIMEDLILKLTDLGLDSCWVTFTDSELVKEVLGVDSDLQVAAIAAFGYGVKTTKRLRLNVLSMSKVDVAAQRQYFAPKKGVSDLVFLNDWGSRQGVEEFIGFYDDMLWEAFYAASLSPSYLNRQPYGFVLRDGRVYLVQVPDEHTDEIDGRLGLGIVLLHFSAVAEQWAGKVAWSFEDKALELPDGYKVVASAAL